MQILAVFDLDFTVWHPEMYQLYGMPRLIPAPRGMSPSDRKETRTSRDGYVLSAGGGSHIHVFDGASFALADINQLKKEGIDIQAAVASRTDEPEWAHFCMNHLIAQDGTTLKQCFGGIVEISFDNKKQHFRRLHRQTGIPYEQMMFFDNEYSNIRSVESLGVKCFYTPDGMERKHWEEAREAFQL
eukprot:Nitzschia sp. Nitz4//scaffold189_size62959//13867//14489//NITZ4_006303-RA/size62959-snap-gene-0.7-mRNA-1//-1//CDS//3329539881//3779//frame0